MLSPVLQLPSITVSKKSLHLSFLDKPIEDEMKQWAYKSKIFKTKKKMNYFS